VFCKNCVKEKQFKFYRYFIFAYDRYYPTGGLSDIEYMNSDKNVSINIAKNLSNDFVYVYDILTDEIVWEND